LEDNLVDLQKLEEIVKDFFGLNSDLKTRGVVRAVERMCNVAGIKN
jgi:hypothetical protein